MSLRPSPPPEALALLDDAACGLLQTTEDGTILRANRTFCEWIGRPADALIEARRFQDLLTIGGRIFHQTHWAPLLRMQGSIEEVKLDVLHARGDVIPMVVNAVRRDHDGVAVHELAAYVARDRDLYERELVRARQRLEELVAEATRLQEGAKDRALFAEQMIGIVSHDLRNPLTTITMGAAILARGDASPTRQHILAGIARSTDRAGRLVADLLDFTQARLGKGISVQRASIDLHRTIADTVDELALIYPGRALRHAARGEGGCAADANRLAQLVGNLVSNAVVHGDAEAPVTVTSAIDPASFSLEVHNAGAPIPEALQADIFQPMTRGADAREESHSVGLGLFIVREIAKAHGGTASVRSTAEEGTTFTAIIPRG